MLGFSQSVKAFVASADSAENVFVNNFLTLLMLMYFLGVLYFLLWRYISFKVSEVNDLINSSLPIIQRGNTIILN